MFFTVDLCLYFWNSLEEETKSLRLLRGFSGRCDDCLGILKTKMENN